MSDLVNTLLDVPAFFDPIDRIEGMVCTFYYANWRGAKKLGPLGIVFELLSAVVGYSAPTITFRRDSGWSGLEIEKLLLRHGVKIWDRGIADKNTLYFCVKRRQVRWAEYLLERAGVPMLSQHDPEARLYGERARAKGLSKEPPARRPLSPWYPVRAILTTLAIGGTGMILLLVLASHLLGS